MVKVLTSKNKVTNKRAAQDWTAHIFFNKEPVSHYLVPTAVQDLARPSISMLHILETSKATPF
jgi:hypothetical protein